MSLKLNTASGGSITLQEADTASNLTLTVPAQAGSIVTANSSGNVGIGTSSPTRTLDVLSSGAIAAEFKRNATGGSSGGIRFGNNDKQFTLYADNTAGMTVYDGATERMRINSSGQVTKPYQPAFLVSRTTSDANTGIATDLKITYDSTSFNIGSHYNTSNGRFTAPITGKYLICVNTTFVSSSVSARYMRTQLWKNGSTPSVLAGHSHVSNETDNGDYHQVTMSGVISLNANDYIEVYWATSASSNQLQLAGFDNNVTFSGQLIS